MSWFSNSTTSELTTLRNELKQTTEQVDEKLVDVDDKIKEMNTAMVDQKEDFIQLKKYVTELEDMITAQKIEMALVLKTISDMDVCFQTLYNEKLRLTAKLDSYIYLRNTIVYYDGSIYQGELTQDVRPVPHGYGIMVFGNSVIYAGQWKNGLYHGCGTIYVPTYPAFHAEWENHMVHGVGWYEGGEKMIYSYGHYVKMK
jgi:hypothetical protein